MNLVWNGELKKLVAALLAAFFFCTITANLCIGIYSRHMRTEYNEFLAALIGNVMTAYPDVTEEKLIQVLNGSDAGDNRDVGEAILAHYGVYAKYGNQAFALHERRLRILHIGIDFFMLLLFSISVFLILLYLKKRQKKISGMEAYMEELNRESYKLYIEDNTDDELSGLRNEVYKLTVFLKEQARRAAEQKRALADSVADISHQLKTPLTSITVLIDNLSENMDMDQMTRQHFMSEITHQITGMSWLVAAMLKISRLDAGVVELEKELLDVNALVDDVLQKLEVAAEWRGIRFSVDIPDEARVSADKKWTAEALMNIVKNAIEHSPMGSTIEISGEENQVYTQITVSDHGEGITEEEREKLFKRFYNGSSAKEDSIGIGLALAKKIVEKQNGYISVDSEIGRGTVFAIKFIKQ